MTDFSDDLDRCLAVLETGGIILYPTDTLWGIGCDATNETAVRKLITLKGKKENNGLIMLLTGERDILKYVTQPDLSVFSFLDEMIKPTTVIYEGGTAVADDVLAADGSIAIRLVKDEFCRHLVKRFRKPIVSTSANFHGNPSPLSFDDIDKELQLKADYVVMHRRDDKNVYPASAIIKWRNNLPPQIIRQ